MLLLLRQPRLQENLLELFRAVLNFEITIRIWRAYKLHCHLSLASCIFPKTRTLSSSHGFLSRPYECAHTCAYMQVWVCVCDVLYISWPSLVCLIIQTTAGQLSFWYAFIVRFWTSCRYEYTIKKLKHVTCHLPLAVDIPVCQQH